jgi:hypothetical protein
VSPEVTSPYLKEIGRPLRLAVINIIPAQKSVDAQEVGALDLKFIPIPEPRPLN